MFDTDKPEWFRYRVVKKLQQCVKSYRQNTGKSRTDRRTDGRTDRIVISISWYKLIKFVVTILQKKLVVTISTFLGTYNTSLIYDTKVTSRGCRFVSSGQWELGLVSLTDGRVPSPSRQYGSRQFIMNSVLRFVICWNLLVTCRAVGHVTLVYHNTTTPSVRLVKTQQ